MSTQIDSAKLRSVLGATIVNDRKTFATRQADSRISELKTKMALKYALTQRRDLWTTEYPDHANPNALVSDSVVLNTL